MSVSTRFLGGGHGGGGVGDHEGPVGGSAKVNAAVAEMCVQIHTSVEAMSEIYYQELRRRWGWTRNSTLW